MESTAISTRALDLLLLLRGSEPEGLGRAAFVFWAALVHTGFAPPIILGETAEPEPRLRRIIPY